MTHVGFGLYQALTKLLSPVTTKAKRVSRCYSMHAALKIRPGQDIQWQTILEYDSEELLQMVLTEDIGYTVTTSSILNRVCSA